MAKLLTKIYHEIICQQFKTNSDLNTTPRITEIKKIHRNLFNSLILFNNNKFNTNKFHSNKSHNSNDPQTRSEKNRRENTDLPESSFPQSRPAPAPCLKIKINYPLGHLHSTPINSKTREWTNPLSLASSSKNNKIQSTSLQNFNNWNNPSSKINSNNNKATNSINNSKISETNNSSSKIIKNPIRENCPLQ